MWNSSKSLVTNNEIHFQRRRITSAFVTYSMTFTAVLSLLFHSNFDHVCVSYVCFINLIVALELFSKCFQLQHWPLFHFFKLICLTLQGFWHGNVPALLMVMPYSAIKFIVLHKLKTFASGSSKSGIFLSTD